MAANMIGVNTSTSGLSASGTGRRMEGNKMKLQVLNNNRVGWQAMWSQIQEGLSVRGEEKYTFTVTLNTENDVTNLRYYFPLYSFLKRKNMISRLDLSGNEDMLQRARQFLSALINEEAALVRFGNTANTQRELICTAYLKQDTSLTPEEAEVVSCVLANMRVRQNHTGQYIYTLTYPGCRVRRTNGRYLINHTLLEQVICGMPQTAPTTKDQIKFVTNFFYETDISDLFPLVAFRQDPQQSGTGLKELTRQYRAYSDSRFEKEGLQLPQTAIPSFEGSPLAELIFYFLLRNLHESDRFGSRSEIITLLQKTALDAKSYAEGLWQIIENAQLHSYGKVAYFGMRIYKADPGATMFELTKETNTRHILWQRYWLPNTATMNKGSAVNSTDRNNIFNLSSPGGTRIYTDFIEFYVLDDAIGDNGKPQGILEKIRSDQKSLAKDRDLSHISEIFRLEEKDYSTAPIDFYIKHYGMRWLRMHAEHLNAIVQVYSPHQTESFRYPDQKGQKYVRASDLGGFCFSNIFPDGYLLSNSQKLSDGSVALDRVSGTADRYRRTADGTFVPESQPGSQAIPEDRLELLLPYPMCYSTEYSILVPLAYGPVPHRKKPDKVRPLPLDVGQDFYRSAEIKSVTLDFNSLVSAPLQSAQAKDAAVNELTRQLRQVTNIDKLLSQASEQNPDIGKSQLNYVSLHNHIPVHIELLAKAFFSLIYSTVQRLPEPSAFSLLFAVDFGPHRDLISEFVRIFSIFYTKQGKNTYMGNVQIALCSDSGAGDRKEVNFILAGETLRSAYNTANSFVYHNADSSLEYVPLLDYLTPPDDEKSGSVAHLCPFDLLLPGRKNICWFLEQMKDKLDTDQRTNQYGCKLSNIHVRLGSKIHINNFYGAELLFHNVGNINRFAYLIARHIDRDLPEDAENIFLVGYENYSAVLLQTVAGLLEERHSNSKIFWVIDTRSSGKFPSISFDKFTKKERNAWAGKQIYCYTVIPIGTTMSTVHKLLDSFRRGFSATTDSSSDNLIFKNHYIIAAVGNCYAPGSPLHMPEEHYLSAVHAVPDDGTASIDHCWYSCTLQPHLNKQRPLQIHYCLWAETQWHLANPLEDYNSSDQPQDQCAMTQPLIQVDKTSTLLNAIFQTPLPKDVLDYYNSPQASKRNKSYIKLLQPQGPMYYIRYGHIAQGDNHYQFYFDFKNMASSSKIHDALTKWAQGISIDADAYNIVISPLQMTNAVFLKTIIDCVFGSNLHLLHIDINGTGKETVRTKFEYISEELKQISSAYSTINFYYVDDSICTGATIQRAYKFLIMLCEQANLDLSTLFQGHEGFRFEKVFLFVNRNSYETARIWVHRPAEDWKGFINLCIPSYNTHANTCPACRVRDRFQLLSKRSATNQLTEYFSRSALKHRTRTPAEYDQYLSGEMLDNPAYLSWLRTYVNSHERVPQSIINPKTYQKIRAEMLKGSADKSRRTLRELSTLTPKIPYEVLMRYVVAQEHFSRLDTMNRAYNTLVYSSSLQETYRRCTEGETVDPRNLDFTAYQTELMRTLLSLLCDALSDGKNDYDRIMVFSSYIKVVSRDYIVRNYFIREAIYLALHCILLLLIESPPRGCSLEAFQCYFQNASTDEAESMFFKTISDEYYVSQFYDIWKTFGNLEHSGGLNVDLLYRVFKIIAHRLALLHSRFIIRRDVVDKVLKSYCSLLDHCPSADNWYLPSVDELVKTYLASIKTATMSEDDDSMCHNLLELGDDRNGRNTEFS